MKITINNAVAITVIVLLSACGGGGGSSNVKYSSAPVVTATKASTSGSNVILSASATDNIGIAAICFSTSSSKPKASDACFQSSSAKAIATNSVVAQYYVWAKNAFEVVSESSALLNICSTTGIAASNASQLNTVCMLTSLGEMVIELEYARAPVTVDNFLKYVNSGFYADLVFHRIMSNFMVQGGGFTYSSTSGMVQKTATYPAIPLESFSTTGLSNVTGTISMARTADLNSATSQFFINVVNNTSFDSATGYAAFGRVISGLDTLSAIKSVAVKDNGSGEVSSPTTPPVIRWAVQLK